MSRGPRDERPIVLAMVGLPARGKTFTARRIQRYLSFVGYSARVFNVGSYRRERLGSHQPHSFFAPENAAGRAQLGELASLALDDTLGFLLKGGGDVAIYDATNSSRARRDMVRRRLAEHGIDLVFIESVCDDPAVIEANVRETKARSPDYHGMAADAAVADFRARIAHYERVYETIGDDEGSYIRILDVGKKLVLHRIHGYLPARLVPLLLSMHVVPRPLYLTRHGESAHNVEGRIGGDSPLSAAGRAYAERLRAFLANENGAARGLVVWTSSLRRTIETADGLAAQPVQWRALDEIDAGVCDGLTYDEVRERMPAEWAARAADKLRYRYPRGESYEDVIQRLDPVVIALERVRTPLVVVAHQAVLRALYAYLKGIPADECPTLEVPLHTVIKITPNAYGCDEERFDLGPEPTRDAPRSLLPPPVRC